MATVSTALSDLPLEQLTLYHTSDSSLASVFIFYGPVSTANATVSSSRIQAHVLSPAGFQSYPRITVSPAAPLYAAVKHLPRDKQGDEVCRGLAVSMLKYFSDLSRSTKDCIYDIVRAGKPGAKVPKLFDEVHAADLANRMNKVENNMNYYNNNALADTVRDIRAAFQEWKLPWVDMDVILPAGTVQPPPQPSADDASPDLDDKADLQYGAYSSLVRALGDPIFLPTTRLKRAPSQPTNVSRSRVFTTSQKEALRLTMCELVDTEERYVAKMYDLVRNVAEEFRIKAQNRSATSTSPDESALKALFPPCLNEILDVNMGFLDLIRRVLEETEKYAIADIAEDTEMPASLRVASREGNDAIGAAAFANALLEWFPRFSQPYADYMLAHNGFTQTLNSFMKHKNSSFSKRVHETGEQQLRSLLMEPVQRLPRYSLLIDTMMSNLPLIHPAVRPFLRARDIIKDICSLDDPSLTDHEQSFRRLKELVDGWHAPIVPIGRLISAVDFNELSFPYHIDMEEPSESTGIMLLYKNCIVLLSRTPDSRMTARGLMADLDSAASTATDSPGSFTNAEIRVARVFDIHSVRCVQSACDRILFLAPASAKTAIAHDNATDLLALELSSTYEGRVSRLIEEFTKAKIEGRFSEAERESGKWTLRSPTNGTVGNIGILACVCEEDKDGTMNRTSPSKIRVMLGASKAETTQLLSSNSGTEMVVSVSVSADDQFRVDIDSIVGLASSDLVTADSFIPVLSKRLLNVLLPLHGPGNPTLTVSIVHTNFEILRYIAGNLATQVKTQRGFRPPSPSKLLSSLLGGNSSKENVYSIKTPQSASLLGEFPKMPPPRGNLPRSNTLPSNISGKEETPAKAPRPETTVSKGPDGQFGMLEQTFAAYALALQSRSGNIVGRTLRGRDNVDRSSVNELYNILLEDPGMIQAAAEVPVDTLFVAFETFMANAWREQMGPILDPSSLKVIQTQFDNMFPRDFDESFRKLLADISPQNRRAFASIVQLLAELLDASGNDGDRGALTAAFAEILTIDGDPMHHISLLDRLVDDFDHLFDDFIPGGASLESTLNSDPTKSVSQNTGSMGSNASSFRKRFGFSLNRDNSKHEKHESESKMSSILRTLSKGKGSADSESGSLRGSLLRSKSIDVDAHPMPFWRPGSRDRPTATVSQEQIVRPGSSQDPTGSISSSIRGISTNGAVKVRRKRRSSLSDLRPPTASTDTSESTPSRPVTPGSSRPRSEFMTPTRQNRPPTSHDSTPPARSSSPAKTGSPSRASPSRVRSPTRPATPSRKENIDPRVIQTERSPRKKADGSGSPTDESKLRSRTGSLASRGGLRERPTILNGSDPRRSPSKTQKLRMQSPQKLRDRLLNEKKAQTSVQTGIKDDLDLISSEIQSLRLTPTPQIQTVQEDSEPTDGSSATNAALAARLRDLELRFDALSGDLSGRTSTMEKDLESSLLVSEKRAKKLDELYREASAENEALYDRFNSELSKVAKDVRAGNTEEALKTQLSGALEDIGRLKKENFRLKREVGGLRAQQAAVALLKASE